MVDAVARPQALLRAESVTAGYGGAPVVHEVSLAVGCGEIVSLIGPNGSGKSTLLKSLVGLLHVSSGRVMFEGRDVTNHDPEELARKGVGYVPQVDDVFETLTVRENLEMGGYLLRAREVAPRIERVVQAFPLLSTMMTRRADKLSGGERKMLAMGRVLMLDPRLVVLDEPTANLAPAIAHVLLGEHIRHLAVTGAAVLLVEQRAKAALAISTWTHVLGGGRCRMEGTPGDLSTRPDFIDSFLGGAVRSIREPGPAPVAPDTACVASAGPGRLERVANSTEDS